MTNLLCLVDVFLNRLSAFLWVPIVFLITDFSYSYEADFIQDILKKNEMKVSRLFYFNFRYIDDVLSLNYSQFGDFVDRIYLTKIELKDTTYTDRFAYCIELYLELDSKG